MLGPSVRSVCWGFVWFPFRPKIMVVIQHSIGFARPFLIVGGRGIFFFWSGLLRRSGLSGGGLDAKRTISAEQVDRLVTKALPCDQISDVRFAVGFSHASTLRNILPELWPLQNRISPPRADSQV